MNDLKVSVIMPIFDPEPDLLKKAINSVLKQDRKEFEFIICDDCSADYVKEIIMSFSDDRIKYMRNEKNSGCAFSLNRCIEAASGELLIRQDADDYSLEGRFSALIKAYSDTKLDIISSNIVLFNESGEWGKRNYPEFPQKKDFLFAIPFMHGACALKKSAVEKAGLYPVSEKTARCEDYALFMEMYSQGAKGMNIQRPLYAFGENPAAVKRRRFSDKLKEVSVKAAGFKKLKLYPVGAIYLIKPILVGLIPPKLLAEIKDIVFKRR